MCVLYQFRLYDLDLDLDPLTLIHNLDLDILKMYLLYAVVTCEIKLFHNDFSLRRRPSEIILLDIISEADCSS